MRLIHRPGSCYPDGTSASRRGFLRALAAAALATGVGVPEALCARQVTAGVDDEPLPMFPVGGFPDGSVRMNFNENPLGPSPKAIRAVLDDGLEGASRYNHIDPLIDALARHHGVPSKNLLVGCGSTEFLQFTPWALLKDGGSVVLPTPTYSWVDGVAESMGREAFRVPLGTRGVVDVEALVKAIRSDTSLVYVANPNNPTGAHVAKDEIRHLVEALPRGGVLFVDEAYHDFLPAGGSALDLVDAGAPVMVARTFSKAYGLAGVRLGYLIAPDEWIQKVAAIWWGDLGINAAAHLAGPAALADRDHVKRYVATVDAGLSTLRRGLSELGFESYPHRAPFFMVDLGRRARPVVRALHRENVYVRDGSSWGLPSFLRVSVGTEKENGVFLEAIREAASKPA